MDINGIIEAGWRKLRGTQAITGQRVTTERTANYESINHTYWQQPRDLPPFSFWTIRAMQYEPELTRAIGVRAAPMFGVEWAYRVPDDTPRGFSWKPGVECDNAEVAEFLMRQLAKIRSNMQHFVESQKWGWAAGEVTLKLTSKNQVEINKFHPRRPEDCRIQTRNGKQVGVEVRNVRDHVHGKVDLQFPRAYFHNHDPEPGSFFGRSVYLGAFSPWADKWLNGGALDVRRLFMHKDAYGGMNLGYPGGQTHIESLGKDVPNRDIARQIVEQSISGSPIVRPSERDSEGHEKWPLEFAKVANNPQHILQYPKDLDAEMRTGIGVTDGVIDDDNASGLGDTKSVAMQAFYSSVDCWMVQLIEDMVEQVLNYLVILNFGELVEFQITHKPFAEQAMENQNATQEQNSEGNGLSDDDNDGEEGDCGDGNDKPPTQDGPPRNDNGKIDISRMSVEAIGNGVLNAAEMVVAAKEYIRLALPEKTGERWITIGADKGSGKKGWPVKIGSDGRMRSGPFRGKSMEEAFSDKGPLDVEDLDALYDDRSHFDRDAVDEEDPEADNEDPVSDSDAPGVSRSVKRVHAYQADSWGMSVEDYAEIADQVWRQTVEQRSDREDAKAYARHQLGVTAGTLAKLENKGFDSSKGVKGLDELGREIASMFPDLGWGRGYDDDGNDVDYSAELWDLIREGKQRKLTKVGAEFHELVDEQIQGMSAAYGLPSDWNTPTDRPEQVVAMSLRMSLRPGATKNKNGVNYTLNRNHRWERSQKRQASQRSRGQPTLFEKGKGDSHGQQSLFDDTDKADNSLFEKETVSDRKARSKDNRYFKSSKVDLESMASSGDTLAQAELGRRSDKRAAVGDGKRKVRVKTIRGLMDSAEAGDTDAVERLRTVDNPNLSDDDRSRLEAVLGGDSPVDTPAAEDGPNDGDRNEDGLIFKDGRWHREEEPDEEASGGDNEDEEEFGETEIATPEPSPVSVEEGHDATTTASETPRGAAATGARQDDENYEFARKSKVGNVGEDLKGSARHKRNAFTSLKEAEESGDAETIVTRNNLLKAMPLDFGDSVEQRPRVTIAMALAMQGFPATAKTKRASFPAELIRKDYVETFQNLSAKATEIAAKETEPNQALAYFRSAVREEIDRLRGNGYRDKIEFEGKEYRRHYNDVANMLLNLHNNKLGLKRSGIRRKLSNADIKDDEAADVALSVVGGSSLDKALGKTKTGAPKRFKPSDVYVKVAEREGGPDTSKETTSANRATEHLVKEMGMRGIQWGNSVTDDERKHHASKLVEAMADLSDLTGMKPEDMSIGGKLGIAIGARGRGNALAHYEPDSKVINLTRKSGVGSLGHEWGHALDHDLNGGGYTYNSENPIGPTSTAMTKLVSSFDFSGFRARLRESVAKAGLSDKQKQYWTSGREMFARSFERFLQRKLETNDRKNTYLVGYQKSSVDESSFWPTDQEVDSMTPMFEQLFAAIRKDKYGSEEAVKMSIDERKQLIEIAMRTEQEK